MTPQEIRTKALELLERFRIEIDLFAHEFYNNTPSVKLVSEHLAKVTFKIDNLRKFLGLLPGEPKPEPSKGLDEVVEQLYDDYEIRKVDWISVKNKDSMIRMFKRILTRPGLVMPMKLKCKCGNNLYYSGSNNMQLNFERNRPIIFTCSSSICKIEHSVTLTPTAIEAINLKEKKL